MKTKLITIGLAGLIIGILLLVITGGVFWRQRQSEKIEKANFFGNIVKSLEERIKAEDPKIARRLEEEKKTSENDKKIASVSALDSFKVPDKCFDIVPKTKGLSCSSQTGLCTLPDGTICVKTMELEGSGNKKTKTFSLREKEGVIMGFFIIKKELLPSDKNFCYKIFVNKVGEENPVFTHSDIITLKQLEKIDWAPEKKSGNDPAGSIGEIIGYIIRGPGEFYFQIEVENVDGWLLRLLKTKDFS